MPRAIPWTRSPSIPWSDPDEPDDRGCEAQLAVDELICNRISNPSDRAACYAHAFDRYASCLAGRNIPHNPWPGYPWR
jgi:hypothetical protein